jgi:polar amino acid transport system substrate-binding protein
MKKYGLLSLLVVLSMVLVACGGTQAPPEAEGATITDLGGATITVAVENAYPPFNYIDEATGEPAGWDYDVVTEICERLNCVAEFSQAAWEGIFPAMAAGEYDMLADGATRLFERELTTEWSIPYVIIGQVLLIRVDEARADLEAFTSDAEVMVGTQVGTTNEIVAKENFSEDRVLSFEEFGGAVAALIAGDIDAVVIDNLSALGFIEANPGQLMVGPQLTSDEPLSFCFPPGSTLVLSVNYALRQMYEDGTLEEINNRWFNPQ